MESLLGVRSWLHTQIRVADADRSCDWYTRMLGFRVLTDTTLGGPSIETSLGARGAKVRMVEGSVGGAAVELQELQGIGSGAGHDRGAPGDILGFALSVDDVAHSYKTAQRENIACDGPPVAYEGTPYHALMVRDPDGLRISLVDYEPENADTSPTPGLFAVSHWLYAQVRVADAERSISWYERMLGFRIVNDLHFEGPPYEKSTGIEGVQIRLVQGFIGGVSMELVHVTSTVPAVAAAIAVGGNIPAFTIGVKDVVACYDLALANDVVCESAPSSFPPTPYHSMFIHDPDGTRIDLCDFEALETAAP